MEFEWDPAKAASNLEKHGISFDEAKEMFISEEPYIEEPQQHAGEERWQTIGPIASGLIVVISTESDEDVVRLISARPAEPWECEKYRIEVTP